MRQVITILLPIVFVVINILWAWFIDGPMINSKRQVPNHLLNGFIYLLLCGGPFFFLPAGKAFLLLPMLFCIRQIFFEGPLNIRRKRNWFYTSRYTSFYQADKTIGSNSLIDKIENFFIDGFINVLYGRPWSFQFPVNMNIYTYNNYLNGKIQNALYGSLLIFLSIIFYK